MIVAILLLICAVEPAGDLAAAQQALTENRFDDAIKLLGDLEDGVIEDTAALIVRGRAYLGLNEYEAAVESLLTAVEKRPKDQALLRDAAWACWGAARNDSRFASAYLEDGLGYARRSGDLMLVANLLYELSRWEKALAVYKKVPDQNAQDNVHVRVRIAHCLAALDRAEEAKAAYALALDEAMSSGDLRTAYDVSWRAKQSGRFLAWMDIRVAAEPKSIELRLYRGYMRDALRMWKEAAEDLAVVVEVRPDHRPAQQRLARALYLVGSAEQDGDAMARSEAIARALLEKDASDSMSWETLKWVSGWAWANANVPHAYSVLNFLHRVDPTDVRVALNLCAMARRLAKFDEADQVFRSMLALDEEDPILLNDYAILKDARGQLEEAKKLWKRALEVDPGNLNALENLFTKTWESGSRSDSVNYLRRGIEAAKQSGDSALIRRWRWFSDRMEWAPSGFGRES